MCSLVRFMRKFIEQAKAKQVMAKKAEQTVKNRQAGTSLLEVLIGLLLVALLLSGLWGLLYTAGQAWRLGVSKLELQQTARYALDIMVRDLRYGENFILEDETHLVYRNLGAVAAVGNIYRYYLNTVDHKLYRAGISPWSSPQPVSGDNVWAANAVLLYPTNGRLFTLQGNDIVLISLTAVDKATNQSLQLSTAVAGVGRYLH